MKGKRAEYYKLFSEGKKRCTVCNLIKDLSNFYNRPSDKRYQSKCNECMVGYRLKMKPPTEDYLLKLELHKQQLKKCPRCDLIKPYNDYGKNKSNFGGVQPYCKECKSRRDKEYRIDPKFREQLLSKKSQYYYRIKDTDKFKEHYKNRVRDYKKELEAVKSCEYRRVKDSLRKLTNSAFKRKHREWIKKDTKTEKLLGVDFFTVKEFIERQFLSGMNWDNYGTVWNLDHVIPLDAAGEDVEMINRLCYYQNLSPTWVEQNGSKGYKIPDICTLWANPIVPYMEKDIVIVPRYNGIIGRYKLQIEPGTRYGSLTVISESEPKVLKSGIEKRTMKCKCDCGTVKDISLNSLRQGKIISCGCARKQPHHKNRK